ncbi:MAG: DUF2252 family protein [Micrococcales bacterium]|nr:DUF2252 family protein [Micrococcales bacterium]
MTADSNTAPTRADGGLATDDARRARIVTVLMEHFGDLLVADPEAFRRKFRVMAASPFAFYRGSAVLFYDDMAAAEEKPADPRAAQVWIQGDLHAENFGTYMTAAGRLVFDVNDFDEAYLGPFDWDLRRLLASLALIGYSKAFSDDDIRAVVRAGTLGYAERMRDFAAGASADDLALTLTSTSGPIHAALERAQVATRSELLDALTVVEGCERRFRRGPRARDVDPETAEDVRAAFAHYLTTLPDLPGRDTDALQVKDLVAASGFGIGSAGLPAFTLLIDGPTDALETDVMISMKQANVCAPSRVVLDERIASYFEHHGHRTVVSQRALQSYSDPWLGWTLLRGEGQIVKELSVYEKDLDWSELADVAEVIDVARQLGHAAAKVHAVADSHTEQTLVPFDAEQAIQASIGDDHERFADELTEFAMTYSDLVRRDHRLFVDAFRNHEIAGL